MVNYVPGSPLADLKRVEEIGKELNVMLQREEKRHLMDCSPDFQALLKNLIETIDDYLEYDPRV